MTEQQQRVEKLIERIERHQAALKLNDTRFCSRYADFVGSPKTWRNRLLGRDWTELGKALEKWEAKLSRMVAILDGGQEIGEYLAALPIAQYGEILFDMLNGQLTDRRVGFLIGPTGIGKSWVMKWLALQNANEAAYVYANESWAESMSQIATGMAYAIGAPVDKFSGKKTFASVTLALRSHPMTVCLDDWQKAGVLGLKMVKGLVDDTRARFILGVYPTSWRRLVNASTDALAEAQQVLGRTIKPIHREWMDGLRKEDVAAYLKARRVRGDLGVCADKVLRDVRANGNMRLLCDAVGLAAVNADETGAEMDADLVAAAVRELCPLERGQ